MKKSLAGRRPAPLGFLDGYRFELIALLDLVDDVLAAGDRSEDGMLAIQPVGGDVCNEELAAVGIGPGIGHGERTDFVLVGIAFGLVFKAVAWTAAPGTCWVAALDHEIGDDAMKHRAVIKAFARQEDKVVDGLGRVFS